MVNDDDLVITERLQWGYSDLQSMALCIVTLFSGSLSVWGSGSILYSILLNGSESSSSCRAITTQSTGCCRYLCRMNKIPTLRDRFLAAICIADIIATLQFMIGVFLIPSDTGLLWAFGNRTSCSIVAFFFFFTIAICWTNTSLSLYFYWKVCRGWTDDYISQHYEKPLHVLAFGLAIGMGTAVTAANAGNIFSMTRSCSLFPYPTDCPYEYPQDADFEVECEGDPTRFHIFFALLSITQMVPFFIALICTIRVTRAVDRSTRRASAIGSITASRRNQRVQQQAILYFSSYLNTFCWPTIVGVMSNIKHIGQVGNPGNFVLIFMCHLLYPLMGFFNYWIYSGKISEALQRCFKRHSPNEQGEGSSNVAYSGSPSTPLSSRQIPPENISSTLSSAQLSIEKSSLTKKEQEPQQQD